jgi:hypothetical protein
MVGRIMLVRWDACQILLACVHHARVWRAACPPPTMSTTASDSAQAKNRQYAQLSRNLAQLSATMEQTAGLMACVRDDLRAMAVVATNTATQCVLLPLARGCRLGDGAEGSWRPRRSCRRIWRRRRRRRRRSERGAFARVSFSPASPLISICAGENERVDMHMLSAPSTPVRCCCSCGSLRIAGTSLDVHRSHRGLAREDSNSHDGLPYALSQC